MSEAEQCPHCEAMASYPSLYADEFQTDFGPIYVTKLQIMRCVECGTSHMGQKMIRFNEGLIRAAKAERRAFEESYRAALSAPSRE